MAFTWQILINIHRRFTILHSIWQFACSEVLKRRQFLPVSRYQPCELTIRIEISANNNKICSRTQSKRAIEKLMKSFYQLRAISHAISSSLSDKNCFKRFKVLIRF